MADRLAVVIAVETYQDEAIPAAAFAESDAAAFARALEGVGFARDRQLVLLGAQATRTAIESRLRKMARTPPAGEALYLYFAGHVFEDGGEGYLACFDTQTDDLAATGVSLRTLLDGLTAAGCERLALFLDPRSSLAGGFPTGAIEMLVGRDPTTAALLACGPGEASHVCGAVKAGAWAHLVTEAFAGRAPRAVPDGRVLTAASLHAHVQEELPRTLRAAYREAPPQTPRLIAPAAGRFVLADVAHLADQVPPTADPRLQPLKRGVLRGESRARVKSLSGYRKYHRLPDRVGPSARSFVAELAAEDVKQDVDSIYAAIRESLGYKRRDVEGSADRNSGFVRTPDFEYSVGVDLADDDAGTVVWRREVAAIREPKVVLDRPFQRVFGELFDTLVFEFTRPFDLEAWVDQIEEEGADRVKLRCASDCSSCDVTVKGFLGVIRLFRDRVEVQGQGQGRQAPGSKGLMEAFLTFQDLFAGRKDLQPLPLLEPPAEAAE